MWRQEKTNLFVRFVVTIVLIVLLSDTSQALSDKRLCADENCKKIISLGKGKINYPAGEDGMVSFKINSLIRIKSKSAGNDPSLWGIEVNGREGYAPKQLIRETKILISEKNLKFVVDVLEPTKKTILNTSENIGRENYIETATTKPLEVIPTESTEKPLSNNRNGDMKIETTTVVTPILSQFVDGTQIPLIGNESDGIVESVKDGDTNLNEKESELNDKEVEEDDDDMKGDTIGDYDDDEDSEVEEKSESKSGEAILSKDGRQVEEVDTNKVNGVDKEISKTLKAPLSSIDNSILNEQTQVESAALSSIEESRDKDKELPPVQLNITNISSRKNLSTVTQIENAEHGEVDTITINDKVIYSDTPLKGQTDNKVEQGSEILIQNEAESKVVESEEIKIHNVTIEEYKKEKEVKEEISSNEQKNKDILFDITPSNKVSNKNTQNEVELNIENDLNVDSDQSMKQKEESKIEDIDIKNVDSDQSMKQKEESKIEDTDIKNVDSDQSMKQKEGSNLEDTDIKQLVFKSQEFEDVVELETVGEKIYYTTTDTPELVNETNMSSEGQLGNQKEEKNKLSHAKEKENIPTSSNFYAEVSTVMPLQTQYKKQESYLPPLTMDVSSNNLYEDQSTYYGNEDYDNIGVTESSIQNSDLVDDHVRTELLQPAVSKDFSKIEGKPTREKLTTTQSNYDIKENKGLFATIMGTVNNMLPINKKIKNNDYANEHELDRILFSKEGDEHKLKSGNEEKDLHFCKQIGPNGECPQLEHDFKAQSSHCDCSNMNSIPSGDLTFDTYIKALASKFLEMSDVLAFLVISAITSLLFIFGYYIFCKSSREGILLSKLNQLESSLLTSQKENYILKHNLMSTRQKLASIEDNSFGSNDMVASLKKELEVELLEKGRLQDQITALQRELENAADAGIELNKLVSELLSNQTGDESIISSVEELQKQLNEQQNTILEINASLAEKSRENSELQLLIAEQNARYESELANLQRDNDELEHEKGNLLTRLEELKNDFDKDITVALEGKNVEIKRLQSEILELNNKIEHEHTKWQTSVAKVEALEECLKNVRKDPSVNIMEVLDVANVKAQLIEAQRKYKSFKERFESEVDLKKLAENQLQIVSAEIEKLKQDFNQSEKNKLEAQTRLEVLSNYFKEKENQLQKELSLKEAIWLKQQGETTTTVDRLTALQEEIQSLKSQNDSLRAEIEAQVAAHKAQIGTLENRAHETWLAARQADRRYEEARSEATALRRKLTALAGGNVNETNKSSAGPIIMGDDLTSAPSPIHMESPGSPVLGRMPPPLFLPPPFMGPPPQFMGMPPPPPFVPPGEMRPAPLGRIMSPPPQRSGRFSPQHLDYEDYLDYECNNTWHRHTYSPPPRTYRSLSPTDSRYDYGTERDLMSTYDTETDFSPPPSPRELRKRNGNNSEKTDIRKNSFNTKRFNNNGPLSSGSEKSYNSASHRDTKTKKGSIAGGKSIV